MRNLENREYKYIASKNDVREYKSLPVILVYRHAQLIHAINGRLGKKLPEIKSPCVCGFSYGKMNKHELTIRFWKNTKALARVMMCEVLNAFGWQHIEYVKAMLPNSVMYGCIKEIAGDEADEILNDMIEGFMNYGKIKSDCGFNLIAAANSAEFKNVVIRIAHKLNQYDVPEDIAIDLDSDDLESILNEYSLPIKVFAKEIILSEKLNAPNSCIAGSNVCKDMSRLFESSKIITSSSDRAKGILYGRLHKTINDYRKIVSSGQIEISGLSTIEGTIQIVDGTCNESEVQVLFNELLKVAVLSEADNIKDLCMFAINNF